MEYYEQLLEECSYLQIDYKRLDKMKHTLNIMKNKQKDYDKNKKIVDSLKEIIKELTPTDQSNS